MRANKKLAAVAGATLLATTAFAAPSVEVTNVQQQYPWTNTVDITYTVAGVKDFPAKTATGGYASNETYFVTFTAKDKNNNPIPDTSGRVIVTNALISGSGNAQLVQWQPKLGQQLTDCTVTPSVFRGEDAAYLVVNLETNAEGRLEHWFEPMSTQDASNARYNTPEYKTTKMVFRRIPAGDYWIGGPKTTKVCQMVNSEHKVNVPKDYYIAVFPTTIAQCDRLKGAAAPKTSQYPAGFGEANWALMRGNAASGSAPSGILADMNTNCTARGTFDLPTCAMLEIAARAGSRKAYASGDTRTGLDAYAFYGSVGDAQYGHGPKPVGLKLPNPWGLYDTIGNVWEASLDTYDTTDMKSWSPDAFTPRTEGKFTTIFVKGCDYGDTDDWASFQAAQTITKTGVNKWAGTRLAFIASED